MNQEAGVLFRKHRVLAEVSSEKHAWINSVGGAEKQVFDIIFSFNQHPFRRDEHRRPEANRSGGINPYGEDASLCMSARPGLTGAWQVSGRSNTSYEARVQMDKNYCLNRSMSGDLVIILKTIPAVISARGAC
jgi:hypothetical protein